MDANLKRSIILDNYQHPKNKGLVDEPGYQRVDMNNESCIDEVHLVMKFDGDMITDIHFDGEACAICTSSTSIMISTLIGKTATEALTIYNNFEHMIEEQAYDEKVLEMANVYEDIYKEPNRKKCALLPWWGIKKLLEEHIGAK